MRWLFIVCFALLLLAVSAYSDPPTPRAPFEDYILLDVGGPIFADSTAEFPFLITHLCTTGIYNITAIRLGFMFTGTNDVTWTYIETDSSGLNFYMTLGTYVDAGSMPTYYALGASSLGGGLPLGTVDEWAFTITLDIGPDSGFICIDSTSAPPANVWKFNTTNCDPDGGPRPYFVDSTGSDLNHPICIEVWIPPCVPPDIDVIPDGNVLLSDHCNADGLSFTFDAAPGEIYTGAPASPLTWSIISGPGSMVGSTYSIDGQQAPGTYSVEIMVSNTCQGTDTYAFNLLFSNQQPIITNAGSQPDKAYAGYTYWWDFDAVDLDECDDLTWSVTISGTPTNPPIIDANGLLQWVTAEDETGIYEICVAALDGQPGKSMETYCFDIEVLNQPPLCGDANSSGDVDIDDIVYTLAYIFQGGPVPALPNIANADCMGETDIDDAVYLIAYVFSGGPPPCDPNNDSVPDCQG